MHLRRPLRTVFLLILTGLALASTGCGFINFAATTVFGEAHLLSSAVPIQDAVGDPALSDDQREKLALIIKARDYGAAVVGLNVGSSYQRFTNLDGKPLAWNLSASKPDRFEAYYWSIPLVGRLPYMGFFNYDQGLAERDRLIKIDYDTLMYEVDAFSTLGMLPDPVASPMLERGIPSLADTVIHELTHNTIYTATDTTYDESLATFVGRTAGVEFLQSEFGADAAIIQDAREGYEDNDRLNAFLQDLITRLNTIYNNGDLSTTDRLVQRSQEFESARQRFASDVLPLMHNQVGYQAYTTFQYNNAYLLLNVRYNNGMDAFQGVYDLVGHDWAQALRAYSDAAATNDPLGYLRGLTATAPAAG
jgi:predicted aminopeptidase